MTWPCIQALLVGSVLVTALWGITLDLYGRGVFETAIVPSWPLLVCMPLEIVAINGLWLTVPPLFFLVPSGLALYLGPQ